MCSHHTEFTYPMPFSWYHVRPYWATQNRPRRRSDFLSWSWAGRSGPVSYDKNWNSPTNTIAPTSFLRTSNSRWGQDGWWHMKSYASQTFVSNEQLLLPVVLHFRTSSLRLDCVGFKTDQCGRLKWCVGSCPADVHISQGPDSAQAFINRTQAGC